MTSSSMRWTSRRPRGAEGSEEEWHLPQRQLGLRIRRWREPRGSGVPHRSDRAREDPGGHRQVLSAGRDRRGTQVCREGAQEGACGHLGRGVGAACRVHPPPRRGGLECPSISDTRGSPLVASHVQSSTRRPGSRGSLLIRACAGGTACRPSVRPARDRPRRRGRRAPHLPGGARVVFQSGRQPSRASVRNRTRIAPHAQTRWIGKSDRVGDRWG